MSNKTKVPSLETKLERDLRISITREDKAKAKANLKREQELKDKMEEIQLISINDRIGNERARYTELRDELNILTNHGTVYHTRSTPYTPAPEEESDFMKAMREAEHGDIGCDIKEKLNRKYTY